MNLFFGASLVKVKSTVKSKRRPTLSKSRCRTYQLSRVFGFVSLASKPKISSCCFWFYSLLGARLIFNTLLLQTLLLLLDMSGLIFNTLCAACHQKPIPTASGASHFQLYLYLCLKYSLLGDAITKNLFVLLLAQCPTFSAV